MTLSIGVVGNCQARGLQSILEKAVPGCRTVLVGDGWIFRVDEAKRHQFAADLAACDVVFMQPWGQQFGPLSLEAIKAKTDKVVACPYLGFSGFFPDCTHVRLDGKQVMSSGIGPYHSAIVAAAYLEGLPEWRAEMLFNAYTYASLGYFDQYEASAQFLLRDSSRLGFDLTDFTSLRRGVFMHTINHPVIGILAEIARQGLARHGIAFQDPGDSLHDQLGEGAVWPVYPEIARKLNVPGSQEFVVARNQVQSYREFIDSCYETYRRLKREFSAPAIDRARAFIRARVRAAAA